MNVTGEIDLNNLMTTIQTISDDNGGDLRGYVSVIAHCDGSTFFDAKSFWHMGEEDYEFNKTCLILELLGDDCTFEDAAKMVDDWSEVLSINLENDL